jgi:hypothetical protein
MALKAVDMFPCASFFASGRTANGFVALLMQLSLVFWPKAAAWARAQNDSALVDQMLQEFSRIHRVPESQYAAPVKRFRQAA